MGPDVENERTTEPERAASALDDGLEGFFPRSVMDDFAAGWTLDFTFVKAVADATEEMDPDFRVSMEQAELILLAVEQMGYRVTKPSNDRVEGRDAALSRRVPSHDGL